MVDIHHLLKSKAFRQGVSFGIISSAMTALGISLSQWSSNGQFKAIVASIIGLSISNSLADAFSIYMSDRATGKNREGLLSGSIVAVIEFFAPYLFLVPFLLFSKTTAVVANAILGVVLVGATGFHIAKEQGRNDKQIVEDMVLYVGVTLAIMIATYYAGKVASYVTRRK